MVKDPQDFGGGSTGFKWRILRIMVEDHSIMMEDP